MSCRVKLAAEEKKKDLNYDSKIFISAGNEVKAQKNEDYVCEVKQSIR